MLQKQFATHYNSFTLLCFIKKMLNLTKTDRASRNECGGWNCKNSSNRLLPSISECDDLPENFVYISIRLQWQWHISLKLCKVGRPAIYYPSWCFLRTKIDTWKVDLGDGEDQVKSQSSLNHLFWIFFTDLTSSHWMTQKLIIAVTCQLYTFYYRARENYVTLKTLAPVLWES